MCAVFSFLANHWSTIVCVASFQDLSCIYYNHHKNAKRLGGEASGFLNVARKTHKLIPISRSDIRKMRTYTTTLIGFSKA